MDNSNIEKIAKNIIRAQTTEGGFSIGSPQYHSLYFEIFFNDIENNHSPSHYDTFCAQLEEKIKAISNLNFDQELSVFEKTWSDWTNMYNELRRKGYLKEDTL